MSYEPTWSMPLPNWGPTGSFQEAATPPSGGPVDGTLVQLPCVNADWLPLMLGALDQLRNPSSWLDTLTDAARESVLGQVDYLRSLVAMAINVPCCNVTLRLTADCKLQFSTDGGVHYSDVDGWTTNIGGCVRANIPVVPPPNPSTTPKDQHACNLAGFMATNFLQKAVQVAHDALVAGNTVLQYFQQLAADIATGNPFLEVLVTLANDMYPTVQAQPIADVAAVAGDGTLWQEVTCIIFDCIRALGYLDCTNWSCVAPRLAAISYSKTWVPPMLANMWTNVGCQFLEQLEAPGALDVVDCSTCSTTWCEMWDFTTSAPTPWVVNTGGDGGNYVPATGVVGTLVNGGTPDEFIGLRVDLALPSTLHINKLCLEFTLSGRAGGADDLAEFFLFLGGVSTGYGGFAFSNTATPVDECQSPAPSQSADHVRLYLRVTGHTGSVILRKIEVGGTGVNPYGVDNCAF